MALVLTNQSSGLLDLLDVNRNGRLSVREMRSAVSLIEKWGAGKSYITMADLPRSYRLSVRRGPGSGFGDPHGALSIGLYGGSRDNEIELPPTTGPAWFRKMDRNHDGDVSLREWLGRVELFRQIDTDGDGLISVEEAERFDQQQRKRK